LEWGEGLDKNSSEKQALLMNRFEI
jgi:hypothetical protein